MAITRRGSFSPTMRVDYGTRRTSPSRVPPPKPSRSQGWKPQQGCKPGQPGSYKNVVLVLAPYQGVGKYSFKMEPFTGDLWTAADKALAWARHTVGQNRQFFTNQDVNAMGEMAASAELPAIRIINKWKYTPIEYAYEVRRKGGTGSTCPGALQPGFDGHWTWPIDRRVPQSGWEDGVTFLINGDPPQTLGRGWTIRCFDRPTGTIQKFRMNGQVMNHLSDLIDERNDDKDTLSSHLGAGQYNVPTIQQAATIARCVQLGVAFKVSYGKNKKLALQGQSR